MEHTVLDKDGKETKEVINGEETVHMTNEMRTSVAIFFGFVSKRALPPIDRTIKANLEEVTRFDTSRTMLPQDAS